ANDASVTSTPLRDDGEWVSNGQLAGAWVQLTWPTATTLTSVVLHDRTLTTENVTGGTFSVRNWASITLGGLPSRGTGLTVSFAARTVTWVRFTVTSATGGSAGLSEFEAYGLPSTKLPWQPPGVNAAPSISGGPFANPSLISDAGTSALSVT